MVKLLFGCGYLGRRVARLWSQGGHEVFAVTRSAQRAATLARDGLTPIVGDVTVPASLGDLPRADTLLFAVGLDRTSGQSIDQVYVDGIQAVLNALHPDTSRFIYISSTGVYGQSDGSWVDEQSPCEPATSGGQACLAAEDRLRASPMADRAIILRLAGIYGPGRIPKLRDLRSGLPIVAAPEAYVNLIHVDDAARIVVECDSRAQLPALFNVTDNCPVLRRSFYEEMSNLDNLETPRFVPPDPNSATTRRAASNKRVCGQRLADQIVVERKYFSFQEGLAAILRDAHDR